MATLWLKFPDEVLLSHEFTPQTKEKLEEVFSYYSLQSPWRKALTLLGMCSVQNAETMIRWHKNKPYFNWSSYTNIISGGSVTLNQGEDNPYVQVFSYKPKHVLGLLKIQWKVARFLAKPPKDMDKLVESIALGLALQSLITRFGPDHNKMADWLAAPDKTPSKYRETIEQIQSIQVRRTEISDVWREHFDLSGVSDEDIDGLPEYYWDDRVLEIKDESGAPPQNTGLWRGKPVCAGSVTGIAVVAGSDLDLEQIKAMKAESSAPVIFVFRSARPETTELFEYADAILFSNGGVLSHACTVAREMGIPCVTDLGTDLYKFFEGEQGKRWLQVDASEATVELLAGL